MTVVGIEALAEMAVQLESTARKLAPEPERGELLRDIARCRAQLTARLSELKAKKNEQSGA
ncbi:MULTISPECIES: hypothetical protein [Bradyrhizobium]|jgi:hypothetical protein|uniref:hypothetical protein n=1 Tax=Bradyrhizobium TaxID=374 RepID=UPI0004B9261E|nr:MULTISPECIES: hypothetical protein [Bradyrhizobium]MCP1975473.1 hypothetical protein [Bradyrhizobium elkanii]MCS3482237.1 hypothetical protein [Bradyrhizobium elkanii]MCS3525078.1 hypothetical protein [Bradyrhizobium elkanii]MCS4075710.1 hypothetical protein [Bradyrhizobium elkanii]MCS4085041.1 hypothetical protein [Bradyrhizobium elkanii]